MKFDPTLYVITDSTYHTTETLLHAVEEACRGGATLIQLREKETGGRAYLELAQQVKAVTDRFQIPLIIDDRVDVAIACDAAGVHVGASDLPVAVCRKLLGPDKIVGATAKSVEAAKAAYEDKLTKCDDFRHSDFVPKKEEVDNIYLTPEQIQEMLNLDLSTKEAVKKRLESLDISEDEKLAQLSKCRITHIRTLEHVRDIFIVGCLTGQRVSDYSRICEDVITEIGGTEFILITQQKTEKKVYIPVDRRVRAILAKYDGKLPPVHPNEMNKLVKTIGLLLGWTHDCGFDEKRLNPKRGRRFCDMLLSHTARRSFATNAYKAGVPLPSIQAITGHSSEAQLRRYLKLDAEEKAVIALKDFKGIIKI